MEVTLAKTAGFCFGVKRAVDKVNEQADLAREGKTVLPIYTYGPIIHNEEVVADLERRGVHVISEDHLRDLREGTIIIRSHGVSRAVQEQMEAQGLNVVDATCPFVKKIHRTVDEATAAGRDVIITGNAGHPEVQGIVGWCRRKPWVVETAEDIEALPPLKEVTVVSQTTFNYKIFKELVEKILEKRYNAIVVNTICNATQERQTEARKIADEVDAMIVIGGRHSSNTQKLYDICRRVCPATYYIQTLVDLEAQSFAPVRSVGITAGASTPNNIIEEVVTHVRSKL
ncbi:MAG: 4-hydroxy-3-methylbut-2-enyl diphosphate reductase [Lachnospiraceae bacterium]|nr:4-hydroxy-3-methylbut-2-enyl diphosphate reductase [Lachnospiraceae bacterium]